MTINEIFEKLATHQIEGMMLHNDMANYYDFLGLKGYKRMHECQYFCESVAMRKTHRYFINHHNRLIKNTPVNSESHIPTAWYDYTRTDVEPEAKKEAIKNSVAKWVNWESKTLNLYQNLYTEALNIGEVAAASYVHKLVKDVCKEHKKAMRLYICLRTIDFDLDTIIESQNELHAKFKRKSAQFWGDKND